ncbi:MAG: hypothetical protein HY574_08010 [candidate division NC10 bacterium]|nr:hypothetical protein [candidate division NC10 bacterium]
MLYKNKNAVMYGAGRGIGGAVGRAFAREGVKVFLMLVSLLACLDAVAVCAQGPKYPPLSEYMMAPEPEVALARSAAPEKVSARATVKILTPSGYKVAAQGDNGLVCMVMRGWAAATSSTARERDLVYYAKLRAPICFDPVASRTVLPLQELQAKLGMEGKGPDQIAEAVQAAYAKGELPRMEAVAFAYMFSADQDLGPGFGAWHPHMMVYTPYYENSMLGGNEVDSGLPVVGDGRTPFAVTVIPVADRLAVKARSK